MEPLKIEPMKNTLRLPFRYSLRLFWIGLMLGLGWGLEPGGHLGGQALYAANKKPKANQAKLSLEEVFASPRFAQKGGGALQPLRDGLHYLQVQQGQGQKALLICSYQSGKVTDTLLKDEWLQGPTFPQGLDWDDAVLAPQEDMVLLATQSEPLYRYSSSAVYYVWNRSNRVLEPLMDSARLMVPTFSPDGSKIAFVYRNNLYIKNLNNQNIQQITFDGEPNRILNGHADWVYEEELELTRSFEWSPDSKCLLFLRFDERLVPEVSIPIYGEGLYPNDLRFKYPKAGEANSKVSLYLYDPVLGKPSCLVREDSAVCYIPRLGWTKDAGTAWYQVLNRHQNRLDLYLLDREQGQSKLLRRESSATWVDLHDHLVFLEDGKHFVHSSEQSGYQRLYLYDMDGRTVLPLTPDGRELTDFYGVDAPRGEFYYGLAAPTPMERQIFRAALPARAGGAGDPAGNTGATPPFQPVPVATLLGPSQGKNTARFSPTFDYYVLQHTDIQEALQVVLYDRNGPVRTLQDNRAFTEQYQGIDPAVKSWIEVPSADSTLMLHGWVMKPSRFQEGKKYPVLMFVYGGPGSQTVDASLGQYHMWFQYLCSLGYVVASVDGRGTGYRGAAFEKATYLQLGKLECEDQLAAARYLARQPWVAADRIGIFGWSFGGYLSSLAILWGSDVFKAAVAVAPVIHWRFYDTIYTERFLRTPAENPEGYNQNSPLSHTSALKGKYLLIHGTADDNVHYQNAAVMAKSLVDQNKAFDFMAYTDKNHGISGGKTRLQLFTKITAFLQNEL
jgi:dipeptidyl-peptidase-4